MIIILIKQMTLFINIYTDIITYILMIDYSVANNLQSGSAKESDFF